MYGIRQVTVTVRGREFTRDVVDHPGSVCVLALTTEDRIVFVRQYRPGIGRMSLELPGGRRRSGEPPEGAALREMEAETGLRPKDLKLVGIFYPAPGYSSEEVHCFASEQMAPGQMQFDASEEIQVEFLPYAEAIEAVHRGDIVDARTLVALLRWGEAMYGGLRPRA
ncbi:MAG TPA: NUDIX hydrolase [Symbiobacteriaceae bacterium]|jgi:ADP-ribose pyrophosphatase